MPPRTSPRGNVARATARILGRVAVPVAERIERLYHERGLVGMERCLDAHHVAGAALVGDPSGRLRPGRRLGDEGQAAADALELRGRGRLGDAEEPRLVVERGDAGEGPGLRVAQLARGGVFGVVVTTPV